MKPDFIAYIIFVLPVILSGIILIYVAIKLHRVLKSKIQKPLNQKIAFGFLITIADLMIIPLAAVIFALILGIMSEFVRP